MSIRFSCSTCGKSLQVPDTKAGAKVVCPGCKAKLAVPSGNDEEEAEEVAEEEPAPRRSSRHKSVAKKYCRNCGKQVGKETAVCMACGAAPDKGDEYCPACGAETNPNASICLKCGVNLQTKATSKASDDWIYPSDPPKEPALMCVLSCLIPGLGQCILGQTGKGFLYIGLAVFFNGCLCWIYLMGLFFDLFLWPIAAVDAFMVADQLKKGTRVGKWKFF